MRKFVCGLATLVWSGALTGSALAAPGDGERIGENVSGLLGGWAQSLYVGIAGLVALVFLFNRRFADLAIFTLAAVIVGGFVLAPKEIAGVVEAIWRTITAT